jgi:hypothetical protein
LGSKKATAQTVLDCNNVKTSKKQKMKTDFKKAVAHKRKMLNCCAWPISRPELVGKKKKIG